MTLTLDQEQQMLHDAVTGTAAANPGDASWPALVELGLPGIAINEAVGGHGGAAFGIGVALDALGYALAPSPLIEHWVAARLLAQFPATQELAAQAIAGKIRPVPVIAPLGSHTNAISPSLVPGSAQASHLLIATRREGRCALYFVAADEPGICLNPRRLADGSVAVDVEIADTAAATWQPLCSGDFAQALIEWARDALVLGRGAEALGLCRLMLEDTLAYARTREQFGHPIASFQALRHRMVDMRIALDQAEALVEAGLHALDHADPKLRSRLASSAQSLIETAVETVGEGAVQIHGAIGITEELRLGSALKRAMVLTEASGSGQAYLRRYRELA
ncbi:MAG: acyl-CoA dehydrogenase family protein [Novosphingobium sp.]|jgi:alkylation response protein AidB-like acyl-CoA dehydrogenase|uniref:acyl-CoA dehydrogenase family protein n=1 Tax=Novosphingobium sp. TaxID=1874826 RepID=UPI00391894A7